MFISPNHLPRPLRNHPKYQLWQFWSDLDETLWEFWSDLYKVESGKWKVESGKWKV